MIFTGADRIAAAGRAGAAGAETENAMSPYEAIDKQVQQAHLQRSAYLAELLSEAIFACESGLRQAGEAVLTSARADKDRTSVFTIDA